MSTIGLAAALVAIWVLLWGSLTVANLVSGVAAVALVLWMMPDASVGRRLPVMRPIPTVRFTWTVLKELVVANAVLTRKVLSRAPEVDAGVIEVTLPTCSEGVLTLIANVLALTPGTMPLEVKLDPHRLYLHVLYLRDVEGLRRDVFELACLAIEAFGSEEAVAGLARAKEQAA